MSRPLPRSSPRTYGACKRWLVELQPLGQRAYSPRGVSVTAVCPGFTHTNFHERIGLRAGERGHPRFPVAEAQDVVADSLRDAGRRQGRVDSLAVQGADARCAGVPDRVSCSASVETAAAESDGSLDLATGEPDLLDVELRLERRSTVSSMRRSSRRLSIVSRLTCIAARRSRVYCSFVRAVSAPSSSPPSASSTARCCSVSATTLSRTVVVDAQLGRESGIASSAARDASVWASTALLVLRVGGQTRPADEQRAAADPARRASGR